MPPAAQPAYRDPCNGHFMHRQATGCCPLEISAANRVVTNGVRPATAQTPLPNDFRDAISTTECVYINRVDHTNDQTFDIGNATPVALMDAVQSGIVDGASVLSELSLRIPRANGDEDMQRTLSSSITAVRALLDVGVVSKNRTEANGNLLRVWAISSNKLIGMDGPLLSVDAHNGISETVVVPGGSSSAHGRSKLSIRRLKSESEFDVCLFMWSTIAHMMGVMPFDISCHLVFPVAYTTRVKHKENFWTAQEYFIECLDLVDRGICKADSVANHDRNILLADARRLGELFSVAGGKKPGKTNNDSDLWNGECQPITSRAGCCPAFNRNETHGANLLKPDGTCKFRHLCHHWVDNKGPKGRCLNTAGSPGHGHYNCDNPNKCSKPLE